MEDSDTEILSNITVSSVHTSDLSSFEEESEEELVLSDSTEEGEIVSDGKLTVQNQHWSSLLIEPRRRLKYTPFRLGLNTCALPHPVQKYKLNQDIEIKIPC